MPLLVETILPRLCKSVVLHARSLRNSRHAFVGIAPHGSSDEESYTGMNLCRETSGFVKGVLVENGVDCEVCADSTQDNHHFVVLENKEVCDPTWKQFHTWFFIKSALAYASETLNKDSAAEINNYLQVEAKFLVKPKELAEARAELMSDLPIFHGTLLELQITHRAFGEEMAHALGMPKEIAQIVKNQRELCYGNFRSANFVPTPQTMAQNIVMQKLLTARSSSPQRSSR